MAHDSGELVGNDGRVERGDVAPGAARSPASPIEQGLQRFHAAASAYVDDASSAEAVRAAIDQLADAGRREGARPEELVVMLKHRCSALLTPERRVQGDSDQLKEQFVTWLIEAYFGGRAD
ncbi:MAG: hypothetical protein ACHQWU_04330 [Gemmatimonadales bacterium]